jgi:hypothetical protein
MRRESVVATVVRRSVSNDNFSPSSTHYDSVAHGRSLGCERARGSVDCGSRASSPGRVWRIERRRHHRRQHAGIDRSRGDTLLRGRGSRLRASARSGTAFRRAASARCDLPRRRRAIQSLYGPMVAGRPRPAACPGRRSCTSRLRRGREPWTRSRATNLTSRRLRTEDFPFRREYFPPRLPALIRCRSFHATERARIVVHPALGRWRVLFRGRDCASVGGSCWLFPGATAGHCGVAETGRCCVGGSAYTCSTGTAYAACAGFDWRTCQAACASTDAACLSACQSNASSSPGGDPSGCTRDSSDDTMCVPSPYCAGSPDGSPCTTDSDCPAGNCQNDGCYPNADGNPCTVDAQCDSNNCFNYCCTPNTYGSPCGADASCASYNCQGGPARGDGSGNGACVTNTPRAGAWTTGPVLRAELASVYEASGMSPSRRLRLQDVQSISPVPSGCRRLDLHLRLSLCGHIVSFEVAGAVSRD